MESAHPFRQHAEDAISRIAPWRLLPRCSPCSSACGAWSAAAACGATSPSRGRWPTGRSAGSWSCWAGSTPSTACTTCSCTGSFQAWDGGLWALRLPSVAATALAAAGVAAVAHRLVGERPHCSPAACTPYCRPCRRTPRRAARTPWSRRAVVWATYLMLRERWTAYAVVLLLGCWLHEFAVLALLAHAVGAWRSRGWRWSAAAVGPAAAAGRGDARQAGQQLGWLGRPSWAGLDGVRGGGRRRPAARAGAHRRTSYGWRCRSPCCRPGC